MKIFWRRMAGIGLGLLIWVAGFVLGFTIYALGHDAAPPPPQEPEHANWHFLQPDDPGFAEHLAEGCPGDVSWSPCMLQLPAVDFAETGFSFKDSDGFITTCLPAGDHLDHFECTTEGK